MRLSHLPKPANELVEFIGTQGGSQRNGAVSLPARPYGQFKQGWPVPLCRQTAGLHSEQLQLKKTLVTRQNHSVSLYNTKPGSARGEAGLLFRMRHTKYVR